MKRRIELPTTLTDLRRHDYLIGWLEALAIAGAENSVLKMPSWVRSALLGKGWICYRPPDRGEVVPEAARTTRITPIGWASLAALLRNSGMAEAHDIDLRIVDAEAERET